MKKSFNDSASSLGARATAAAMARSRRGWAASEGRAGPPARGGAQTITGGGPPAPPQPGGGGGGAPRAPARHHPRGGGGYLGNQEKARPSQRASQRGAARVHRDWNGERERSYHGQHPPDVRGAQCVDPDRPQHAQDRVYPVTAYGLAPRGRGILARRALPA